MFKTKVSGINCYAKPVNESDLYPTFVIYDRRGYSADWIEKKMSEDDYFRLLNEFEKETHGR